MLAAVSGKGARFRLLCSHFLLIFLSIICVFSVLVVTLTVAILLMYADDLILLSATVNGLQAMLNCCFSTRTELRLQFNYSKSTCTAICTGAAHSISVMQSGSSFISRSSSFRYPGITFTGRKKLSVDIDVIKRKYYAACNCIFGQTYSLDEILRLSLQESYCLSVWNTLRPLCVPVNIKSWS